MGQRNEKKTETILSVLMEYGHFVRLGCWGLPAAVPSAVSFSAIPKPARKKDAAPVTKPASYPVHPDFK